MNTKTLAILICLATILHPTNIKGSNQKDQACQNVLYRCFPQLASCLEKIHSKKDTPPYTREQIEFLKEGVNIQIKASQIPVVVQYLITRSVRDLLFRQWKKLPPAESIATNFLQTALESQQNNGTSMSIQKAATEATADFQNRLDIHNNLTRTTLDLVKLKKQLLKTTT
jgi:hypothetical protein